MINSFAVYFTYFTFMHASKFSRFESWGMIIPYLEQKSLNIFMKLLPISFRPISWKNDILNAANILVFFFDFELQMNFLNSRNNDIIGSKTQL